MPFPFLVRATTLRVVAPSESRGPVVGDAVALVHDRVTILDDEVEMRDHLRDAEEHFVPGDLRVDLPGQLVRALALPAEVARHRSLAFAVVLDGPGYQRPRVRDRFAVTRVRESELERGHLLQRLEVLPERAP